MMGLKESSYWLSYVIVDAGIMGLLLSFLLASSAWLLRLYWNTGDRVAKIVPQTPQTCLFLTWLGEGNGTDAYGDWGGLFMLFYLGTFALTTMAFLIATLVPHPSNAGIVASSSSYIIQPTRYSFRHGVVHCNGWKYGVIHCDGKSIISSKSGVIWVRFLLAAIQARLVRHADKASPLVSVPSHGPPHWDAYILQLWMWAVRLLATFERVHPNSASDAAVRRVPVQFPRLVCINQ